MKYVAIGFIIVGLWLLFFFLRGVVRGFLRFRREQRDQ